MCQSNSLQSSAPNLTLQDNKIKIILSGKKKVHAQILEAFFSKLEIFLGIKKLRKIQKHGEKLAKNSWAKSGNVQQSEV